MYHFVNRTASPTDNCNRLVETDRESGYRPRTGSFLDKRNDALTLRKLQSIVAEFICIIFVFLLGENEKFPFSRSFLTIGKAPAVLGASIFRST